jgi:glycosyltransferase involved in cell wall biosynthesis
VKVALLTGHLSGLAGGFAAAVPGVAAAVRAAGAETHVVGLRDDHDRPGAARLHIAAPVTAVRAYGPRPLGWSPGLGRALASVGADLLHQHGIWMYASFEARRWRRRSRRPHVVSPHGMLDPWALGRSRWKKRLASDLFERANLAGASAFHATSEQEAMAIRAYGLRQPIAIVPNGVDTVPVAQTRREDSGRTLLFLSRIHPKKGLDMLLPAWAALERRHPAWSLAIAGGGETHHIAQYRRLAEASGAVRVRWLGPLHGPAKAEALRGADLFVLPTYGENFGIAVAEALAHGMPVVTTTAAPWEGLMTHGCGWWVDVGRAPLVAALDDAMGRERVELRAMGERGRAWVAEAFAWPRIGQQMVAVYAWLLGGGSPPSCVMTD